MERWKIQRTIWKQTTRSQVIIPINMHFSTIIFFQLFVVLISVTSIMLFKIVFTATAFEITEGQTFLHSQAKLLSSILAATINLIVIVILNQIYQRIALWLTNLEHPRTQSDFEQSFTIKIFLFQTINFYSSLMYIAYIKVSTWYND